jgi:hypothetical protein
MDWIRFCFRYILCHFFLDSEMNTIVVDGDSNEYYVGRTWAENVQILIDDTHMNCICNKIFIE